MIIVQKACYSSTVSLQTDWEIGALSLKLHVAVTRHHFRLVLPVAWAAHKVYISELGRGGLLPFPFIFFGGRDVIQKQNEIYLIETTKNFNLSTLNLLCHCDTQFMCNLKYQCKVTEKENLRG